MLQRLSGFVGRLSVSKKLLLIYLLDLSAIIFITNILIDEKYIAINFARKEIQGLRYIGQIREVLLDLSHPELEAHIPDHLEHLRQAEAADGAGMNSSELNARFVQAMRSLPEQRGQARIYPALKAGRSLLARVGDQSNLILDPDLDSYYAMSLVLLRFPELLDLLLQLPQAAPSAPKGANIDLLLLEGKLTALVDGIDSDYGSAYAGNAQGELVGRLEPGHRQLQQALGLVLSSLRDMGDGQHLNELGELRSRALMQSAQAWREVAGELDRLLEARVDLFFKRMWEHLGTAALLLMVILFLVFYVARKIAQPLGSLAGVVEKVSQSNDYSLRARWDSHDEIGQLVRGFNHMLERLDYERVLEQQLATQAAAAEAQLELLGAIALPMLVTSIPEHRVLHANAQVMDWLGDRLADPWARAIDSRTRGRFFQKLADEGEVDGFEVRWLGQKQESWALLSARRLRYQGIDAMLTTITPIDQQKRMESRLQLWARVFEATSEGIMVVDAGQRIVSANAALARASGYHVDELLGRAPEMLHSDRHDVGYYEQVAQSVRIKGAWKGEFWMRRKNGDALPQWKVVNTVRDELGEPVYTITILTDISERKAQEARIEHLAHHDALTGLPNRLLFQERLRLTIDQAARTESRIAVLFIDLDRFKTINDSLGHQVGDGLLKSVAERLLGAIRVGDTVSRLGGDEFVIILNRIESADEVARIIEERLIPMIREPHRVDGVELYVSCSVGVAVFPGDAREMDELMRHADTAMYKAKSGGRDSFQFFTQSMNEQAQERLHIEHKLRHALERDEFELHFQPLLDVDGLRVLGAEALIRWHHPELGMMPPGRFISIAEETGLIVPISEWVLTQACMRLVAWRAAGLRDLFVAVNISAAMFRHEGFLETVQRTLRQTGIPPGKLELELTESMLMDDAAASISVMNGLKAIGVKLAVDDFGTGYSNLKYLNRFPLDKLKVDRSFVSDMLGDPTNLAITRAIIGLGHTLGLRVTAEGVEHEEELSVLQAAGCDEIQGYYFSHPLPEPGFIHWAVARAEVQARLS